MPCVLFALAIALSTGATEARILLPGQAGPETAPHDDPAVDAPFSVARGREFEPIEIPRDEQLDYVVEIDIGILGDLDVGTVSLSSGVEPYFAGLPDPAKAAKAGPTKMVGWIRSQARGSYLGYELKHDLDVRHLPQSWPSAFYRDTQAGSENRRRELKFGMLDGQLTAGFNNDGHCHGCTNPEHFIESTWAWGKPYHCKKCKRAEHRVWDDPVSRTIPAGTVDLLTAVYLARSMVRRGKDESTFPVLDKQKLWILTVRRGRRDRIRTPSGKFSCVLMQLETRIPPGEPQDKKRFEGLFGIQGTIRIWMDAEDGVPVMISGDLPVPVIGSLEVNVRLKGYRGTPEGFAPSR